MTLLGDTLVYETLTYYLVNSRNDVCFPIKKKKKTRKKRKSAITTTDISVN